MAYISCACMHLKFLMGRIPNSNQIIKELKNHNVKEFFFYNKTHDKRFQKAPSLPNTACMIPK